MKKIFLNTTLISFLLIGFSGCLGEDISCSEETVQELVKELTQEDITNNIFLMKYQNGDYGETNMVTSSMIMGANGNIEVLHNFLGGYGETGEDLANSIYGKLLEGKKELVKSLTLDSISLDTFLTTAKDKELSKVECTATINISHESNTYSFNTEYTAQLTDDKEQVYVEVVSLTNNK